MRSVILATALAAIFPAARAQKAPDFDMDTVVITAVAPRIAPNSARMMASARPSPVLPSAALAIS